MKDARPENNLLVVAFGGLKRVERVHPDPQSTPKGFSGSTEGPAE